MPLSQLLSRRLLSRRSTQSSSCSSYSIEGAMGVPSRKKRARSATHNRCCRAPCGIDERHANKPAKSERLMRAVAERRGLGLLALAQSHFFLFSQRKLDRLEPGALMRPVTERLVP